MTTPNSQLTSYLAGQLSIIPIKADGSKKSSLTSWKAFEAKRATPAQVKAWFPKHRLQGVAIIGGKVSGNLEILDFDSPELIEPFAELANEHAPGLLARLVIVRTPRGGQHLYYRCAEIGGNQKLALRQTADGKIGTLIETRGEGGYALAPGCPPECHPLKKTYDLLQGSFDNIPVITPEERDILFACARSFNEYVKDSQHVVPTKAATNGHLQPGQDFNARGDLRGLLEKHGWKSSRRDAIGEHWIRPSGNRPSAKLFHDSGRLWVFSTNATPLEYDRSYDAFGCFTRLEHNGDFKAAAKALTAEGYGTSKTTVPKPESQTTTPTSPASVPATSSVNDTTTKKEPEIVWTNGYASASDGLKLKKTDSNGKDSPISLCNFTASIVGDVVKDDGIEQRRCYEMMAQLAGEEVAIRCVIPAADFATLKWLDDALGARAVVYPGKAEHVKCAIKLLSKDIQARRVVAHTGWRGDDGEWLYYHKGGAIGASGLVTAEVDLPGALAPFLLPSPPQGQLKRDVIQAVHELLTLTDDATMVCAVGGVFVAILGNADFALHLAGTTGRGKSQLAALIQAFFGSAFDDKHFPASWESTGNSIETIAHTAKDAVCVVDDFCPRGTPAEVSKLHALADRVLRGQGNHAGRARLRADSSLREGRPPRGLILSTGEDIPKGQSLRGRLLILEITKSIINHSLTDFQNAAAAGIYAQATSAFIQWLATNSRIAEIQARQTERKTHWRSYWSGKLKAEHNRIPSTLALLSEGWTQWLTFAEECRAITAEERNGYWERIEAALTVAAKNQSFYQTSDDPALRFVELLQAAFASGKAYLDDCNGGAPKNSDSWGWRNGQANGERVGWLDGEFLYLIPDATYSLINKLGDFAISQTTLWRRLKEAGFLVTEAARQTNKMRRTVEGSEQTVVVLKRGCFAAENF